MSNTSFFTLSNAIRLMIIFSIIAVCFVIAQSCQTPKTGLDQYAKQSLKRLTILEKPPAQPRLSFQTASGHKMTLQDYKGQVILLNVWATWCAPCIAEMPTLNRLQDLRKGPGFQVVTISLDRTAQEAANWFKDNAITSLTPFHDSSFALPSHLQVPGLPVSILYDKMGREIARLSGEAVWDSPEALELINKVTS